MRENLYDLQVEKHFLGHRKAQTTKENIDKMHVIKTESFCSLKDTGKTMKRQTTGWEKGRFCLTNIQNFYNLIIRSQSSQFF